MTKEDRHRIDAELSGDGTDRRRRFFRLLILMALSTAIATFGIATNSTAVVIGAMLIAPLMAPILATASALLRGWPVEAFRSGAVVVAAMSGAIAVAWVLAAFIPDLAVVVANDEVASRTAPNIVDLAIALAAGAAGAFAVRGQMAAFLRRRTRHPATPEASDTSPCAVETGWPVWRITFGRFAGFGAYTLGVLGASVGKVGSVATREPRSCESHGD